MMAKPVRNRNCKGIVLSFGFGLLTGALTGLLCAPYPGVEMRKKIYDKVTQNTAAVQKYSGEVAEVGTTFYDGVRSFLDQVILAMKAGVYEMRQVRQSYSEGTIKW